MRRDNLPYNVEVAVAKAWISYTHEEICRLAHDTFGGVGSTTKDGFLPLYTRRSKAQTVYLGNAAYRRKKIALKIDRRTAPELPKGKPIGIFEQPVEEVEPAWSEVWEKGALRSV
ncbi:acyl-CoA dehydrogenase family protein [Chloroflexota bacterium]